MKTKLSPAFCIVIVIMSGCASLATSLPLPSHTSAHTNVPATTTVPSPTSTPLPTNTPIPMMPSEPFSEPQLDHEFWIQLGERVALENGRLTIKFVSLAGDSRCPEGVVCVWMGNAEVILEVSENEIRLNTILDPTEALVGDYQIELRDVVPYPKAGVEYLPEEYRVKIVVSKQ